MITDKSQTPVTLTPQYTPTPRTYDEWMALHRPQLQTVLGMWKAGRYEAARKWHTGQVRPLRKNANKAREAASGTHTDHDYDHRQWALAKMLTPKPKRITSSILEREAKSPASQIGDTAEVRNEATNPSPHSAASNYDNTAPKADGAININDTIATPAGTIEQSCTNEKFTKFEVGDTLRIPVSSGRYPVHCIVNDPRYSRVYYGFMFEVGGTAGCKYYSEQELSELNPQAVQQQAVVEVEPEDTEDEYSKPTSSRARLDPRTRDAWLGLMVAGRDAINDGLVEDGMEQVRTYSRKLLCCYDLATICLMFVDAVAKAEAISTNADVIAADLGIVQLPLIPNEKGAA